MLLGTGVPAAPARIRAWPDGFLPLAIVTNGVVLRSAFAAAAIPAGWFALRVAVPLILAARGWSPLGVGLVLAPSALLGLLMPRVTVGSCPGGVRTAPSPWRVRSLWWRCSSLRWAR
jgi:hypothetical protein